MPGLPPGYVGWALRDRARKRKVKTEGGTNRMSSVSSRARARALGIDRTRSLTRLRDMAHFARAEYQKEVQI